MLLWKWVGCSKKCEGLSKDISANQYVPKPQPNTLQATHSRIALFPSVSLLFCFSYLSLSLHLHSSQFSPRVQAVAKKRIGEPVYVLDMLSFFSFFFPALCDEFRTFSAGNVTENQSLPPSPTSFYFLSRSVPSASLCLSLCVLASV